MRSKCSTTLVLRVQKSDTLPFTMTGLKWRTWLYLLEWQIQPSYLLRGTCYALCFYHPSFPFYLLLAKIRKLGRVRVTSLQSNVLRTTGHVVNLFHRWVLYRGNGTVIWISCQPLKHNSVWCANCLTKRLSCFYVFIQALSEATHLCCSTANSVTRRQGGEAALKMIYVCQY